MTSTKFLFIFFTFVIVLTTNVFSKDFYEFGRYEINFLKEYPQNKSLAEQKIQDSKKDKYFSLALKELKKPVVFSNKSSRKISYPDYYFVLDNLKKSNTEYAAFVGLSLYVQIMKRFNSSKDIKKYGLYFSKKLSLFNYCFGYTMEGIFMKELRYPKSARKKIYKKGIDYKCRGTENEHFFLVSRYHGVKYEKE